VLLGEVPAGQPVSHHPVIGLKKFDEQALHLPVLKSEKEHSS